MSGVDTTGLELGSCKGSGRELNLVHWVKFYSVWLLLYN
ncbi:hypothetical protein SNOG_06852 [Parastagonospora nodorum SN15]|uniref:Uncharacterized protein n=1 Tax=Phaeosphaeria nodorum (strain SN15 / ATCC MYA-4574 / FGSC 10173) TaxID=321614 RepID=Q0UN12_PHANO|nr:hypothetical protein SNOG_06852 [Parastagonospora nodorum SN15]EAT85503.1 hypothetical protein SNOG_06852 [Parastagonospora nodorum SN15]